MSGLATLRSRTRESELKVNLYDSGIDFTVRLYEILQTYFSKLVATH